MKLAIIGGAGVRVPLLLNGLAARGLPIDDVALYDIDRTRQTMIAELAGRRLPGVRLTSHDRLGLCLDGAAFVVTSIRVGGLAAREHDEAVALAHGLVGQETVGPAGFAMAVRTIPPIREYARAIRRHAPEAWVINFTNPVGIVTQAMRAAADVKAIGICDTPTELFAAVAHALNVSSAACEFDYLGLNHLGWLREVRCHGRPLLREVWEDAELLERIYLHPLFPADYLARLRLLPTEYVYYYDFPDRAVANIRAAGHSRGSIVARLTERLFADLAGRPADPIAVYERYVAERSASYMQIESGQPMPVPPSPWAELAGYDRIAFDVMSAIVGDTSAVIPVDIPNAGTIAGFDDDDIVEVPCVIGAKGPRPIGDTVLPQPVRDLAMRVKEYERLTIDAAARGDPDSLTAALAHNPLVPSREVARDLIARLTLA